MHSTPNTVLFARAMSPFHDAMSVDDQSDAASMMSASFAYPRAPSSMTSDTDFRPPSPTNSVLSMTPSRMAASYREEYGRHLNNYSEVYRLPADDEELDRLNKQHLMFRDVMGKYPPGLHEALKDDSDEEKTVIDLGCGSGSWILDIAHDYPHASCLAVDLVPMQSTSMPPNCRSEVDDINLGLQHYFGAFNVVHGRLICTGIKDYPGLIDQIAMVLRPGGLVSLTEYNFYIYDGNKQLIHIDDSTTTGPWLPRWMHEARKAIQKQGADVDAAHHLFRWVSEHPDYERVLYRDFWFQLSPWKQGKDEQSLRDNRVGTIMREDMSAFLASGRPLLLGAGVPEDRVTELQTNAIQEMKDARTPLYVLVENVVAHRRPW